MTQLAKGLAAVLIGVGIFAVLFDQERMKRSLGEVIPEESNGGDPRVVSKTGAYQNTKFMHLIDYKFGSSLVNILTHNNIASITDMGYGDCDHSSCQL